MDRRNFIKIAGLTGLFGTLPQSFQLRAAPTDFNGKFLVTIQVNGGWDVSSLCDPKMNVPGEDQINHWAINDETRTAGNIQYAPFGTNQNFFEKYHQDMMVINGLDAQTNSHTAGETHNWSGRISSGYPTLTALYAAANAPDLPISYINNSGYAETAGIIRNSSLRDADSIRNIIQPNTSQWHSSDSWIPESDWSLIDKIRREMNNDILKEGKVNLRQKLAINNYQSALDNSTTLNSFIEELNSAGDIHEKEQTANSNSDLKRQAQLALIAMKAGVSIAADLYVSGFDTHEMHDELHGAMMSHITDSIDYFWQYAEQLGIADRIVMMVASDFSRTPYYNDTNGKDHWPVGSAIIMERDASWGNRVVGLTDEGQNIIPINPTTMQPDANNGKIIYPKHVMQSLREYMGIADSSIAQPFKFNNEESFNFFDANISTPQGVDPRNLVRV